MVPTPLMTMFNLINIYNVRMSPNGSVYVKLNFFVHNQTVVVFEKNIIIFITLMGICPIFYSAIYQLFIKSLI